jgi:hypothetical protein
VRGFAVAIGSPDEPPAVGSEHREGVEIGRISDALEASTVFVDDIEIEIAAVFRIGNVRSEDDAFSVGMPVGREIRGAVAGHLVLVGTVGIHNPNFQIPRTDETSAEQVLVVGDFFRRFGMLGTIDDFLAIVRPERTAVVTQFVGKLLHVGAVDIHGKDIQIAVPCGSKDDVLSIPSDGGLGVVALLVGKLLQIAAIRLGGKDLIAIVNRPHIAAGVIGLGRTIGTRSVSGGEKDAIAGGKEIGTGSASLAGADELGSGGLSIGRVHGNRIDLIAGNAFALVLKNQSFVIEGKISFGILAAEGQLSDIP